MNHTYQFFDFTTSHNVIEKIRRINKGGAIAVFDLEDAFFIAKNKKTSGKLKSLARKSIYDLLDSTDTKDMVLGIRINNHKSDEYKKDLHLLKKFNYINWNCIFLPKVESKNGIKNIESGLKHLRIKSNELIPIIESKKGLNNIDKLSSCFCGYNIFRVAFGHCDYNLDCGHFPFPHLGSSKLLATIKKLYATLKKYSLEYINTPYLNLRDSKGFKISLRSVYGITGEKFSQVTLCKSQSETFNKIKFDSNKKTIPLITVKYNPVDYAKNMIKLYDLYISKSKGFAVCKNKSLISPHEYIAAKNYLDKIR